MVLPAMNNHVDAPLFSIITVCKNASLDLEKTILSVVNQNFKNYEYLIVDGDSNDGTKELVNKYRQYLTAYISEKDTGIYSAMNKGIRLSKGKYLLFLNAGDTLACASTLKDVSGLQNSEDILIGRIIIDDYNVSPRWGVKVNDYFLFRRFPPHQASFIKKELFDLYGMYDEAFKLVADYNFFLRAIVKNRCTYKQIDLIVSYFKGGGVSQQKEFRELLRAERNRALRNNFSLPLYSIYTIMDTATLLYRSGFVKPVKKIYASSIKHVFKKRPTS